MTGPITLDRVELLRVAMPLVRPFRTSFGTETARDVLLLRVETAGGAVGWGECTTMAAPRYSAEWTDGAAAVLERHLVPAVLDGGPLTARQVAPRLTPFQGHRMAKGALEMAVLDAELRTTGTSLAQHLGATRHRVPAGVSVGIAPSIEALLEEVDGYVTAGYVRIKLKIEPGWDLEPVAAVRELIGDRPLQVDANAAYTLADARTLAGLDAFDLVLVEQPFAEEDLAAHARLAEVLRTPVCLDESIVSPAAAADAITRRACGVVNVKAGRVGGYLTALTVAEVCAAHGVGVWCGGMVETGLGRAANLALAATAHFVLPGDTSAADRFYATDLVTEPAVLDADGHVAVPQGPGLGVEVDEGVLARVTTQQRRIAHR